MEHNSNFFAASMAILGTTIVDFYSHLQWWLLLGVIAILVDLRFGILAAKVRGETIRTSRAIRRTLNKAVDYLGIVTLAEMLWRTYGAEIGTPVVSMGILFILYGVEISSILNNYFEYKGLPWRIDMLKFLRKKSDLADAIDTGEKTTTND